MGACVSHDVGQEKQGAELECPSSLVVAKTTDCSSLVASGDCRICFETQMFANDPVVHLGCKCLGELSYAHASCIRKWFPKLSVHTGVIACEICKKPLGGYARSIVKDYVRSNILQMLLRRGMVHIGRMIQRTVTAIDEFNQAMEYGFWADCM